MGAQVHLYASFYGVMIWQMHQYTYWKTSLSEISILENLKYATAT